MDRREIDPSMFAWTQLIPSAPPPQLKILTLSAGQHEVVTLLSDQVTGVWTHWDGKKSVPCFPEFNHCDHCLAGRRKRWEGYLAAWHVRRRALLVKLTSLAVDNCPEIRERNGRLRSFRLDLYRPSKGRNASVRLQLLEPAPGWKDSGYPKAINVAASLQYLWHDDVIEALVRNGVMDTAAKLRAAQG